MKDEREWNFEEKNQREHLGKYVPLVDFVKRLIHFLDVLGIANFYD